MGEGDEYDGDSEGSSRTRVGRDEVAGGGKGGGLEDEVGELVRLVSGWSVR